mmetsp:Transcript_102199/g.202892  ORF Transcript_102199/g.202892 Transcript_102199/m.202892 type:complete len:468 (-) Transcript_102199:245-1648(-)
MEAPSPVEGGAESSADKSSLQRQFCGIPPRYQFPAVSLLLWFVIGLYTYMRQPWGEHNHNYSLGEALYLMVQIITTVGYGDRVGPSGPKGFAFATMYVIVGVVACANLVSLLVDNIRNRAVTVVPTDAVGRLSSSAHDYLLKGSRTQAKLPAVVPKCISEPIHRRWRDVKKFLIAIAWLSLFLLLGTIFFANYCEKSSCVKGHCCTKLANQKSIDCKHILPLACQTGSNEVGCVKKSDLQFHCKNEDGNWETCKSHALAWEEAYHKGWTITWPGQSSAEKNVPHNCGETTATCCEGKGYMEAFYMSVVTLTTVGFGDVTPTTRGGIWFSIPWMLFGVASFANLVAAASVLMLGAGRKAALNAELLDELKNDTVLQACQLDRMTRNSSQAESTVPPTAILRAEFILHVLLQDGLVSEDVVKQISEDFTACDTDQNGWLDEDDLVKLSARVGGVGQPEGRSLLASEPQG